MAQVCLQVGEADGYLPPVCMVCGEPASGTKVRSMAWTPPWVGLLLLGTLLPYLIVASILTKRTTVEVPLCERHQGHWFNRNLLVWGTFSILLLVWIAAITLFRFIPQPEQDTVIPFICLGSSLLFVVWVIVLLACQYTAIRPKEITDYEITITGVCDAFVDAVDDARAARRARKRERESREFDEEDEAPRRRRKPPSDAIEE